MDEKPKFWDFYRASRRLKDGEHAYLSDRLCDLLSYLRILLFIVYLVILGLITYPIFNNTWRNIIFDLFIVAAAGIAVLDLILISIFYLFAKLKKILEDEPEKTAPPKTNPKYRKINLCAYLILFLFLFLNSVSFAYLLYFAEGKGNAAQVRVSIDMPGGNSVSLSDTSPQELNFPSGYLNPDNRIGLKINTYDISGDMYVYINGGEVGKESDEYGVWFFWQNDYFKSSSSYLLNYYEIKQSNTLEVKSDTFDKKWTFTIVEG